MTDIKDILVEKITVYIAYISTHGVQYWVLLII